MAVIFVKQGKAEQQFLDVADLAAFAAKYPTFDSTGGQLVESASPRPPGTLWNGSQWTEPTIPPKPVIERSAVRMLRALKDDPALTPQTRATLAQILADEG